MKTTHRISAIALALAIGAGLFAFPTAARASEEGRRNTAIALGAAAAGLLLTQRNKVPGLVVAAGAAYAYSRYQDSENRRHRWDRDYGYYDRYDRRGHDYDRDDRYYQRGHDYDRDDRYSRSYDRGYRNGDRNYRGHDDDDYGHRR